MTKVRRDTGVWFGSCYEKAKLASRRVEKDRGYGYVQINEKDAQHAHMLLLRSTNTRWADIWSSMVTAAPKSFNLSANSMRTTVLCYQY